MKIFEAFDEAFARTTSDLLQPELLPERLAGICAQILPVDGAGISLLFDEYRLPLGASDEVAADAERLQFTVGDGPCLSVHGTQEPVLADEDTVRARWPAFHDALVSRGPVRAVISVPLEGGLSGLGALDLFAVPPRDITAVSMADARTVAHRVVAVLEAGPVDGPEPWVGPPWLNTPAAARRSMVWQAIGFLNVGLEVSSTDALALLRGHAFSTGQDIDTVAGEVVTRELPVQALALDAE